MFNIRQELKIKTTWDIILHSLECQTQKNVYHTKYWPGYELFELSYIMREWLWDYLAFLVTV